MKEKNKDYNHVRLEPDPVNLNPHLQLCNYKFSYFSICCSLDFSFYTLLLRLYQSNEDKKGRATIGFKRSNVYDKGKIFSNWWCRKKKDSYHPRNIYNFGVFLTPIGSFLSGGLRLDCHWWKRRLYQPCVDLLKYRDKELWNNK